MPANNEAKIPKALIAKPWISRAFNLIKVIEKYMNIVKLIICENIDNGFPNLILILKRNYNKALIIPYNKIPNAINPTIHAINCNAFIVFFFIYLCLLSFYFLTPAFALPT